MKKLFTVTALTLALISTAHADTGQRGFCSIVSEIAEVVMTSRQAGVPLREMMEMLKGVNAEILKTEGTKEGLELIEVLIIDAYKKPLQPTVIHKKLAIQEFENEHYLRCHDIFSGD